MIVNHKFTILPFTSSLQEEVLCILAQEPMKGTDLLGRISVKLSITKQGLYKALRKLLHDEIVIKNKNLFSLNKVWLSRLTDFIQKSEISLGFGLPFSDAQQTGRRTIIFKDAEVLDIYWGHLFLSLGGKFKDEPFFFFNHHSWSIYERPYSETYLYETSLKMGQRIMLTLGSNTVVAQKFKKKFSKNNIQIAIDESFSVFKNDNLCIVGDYLIITRYDNKTVDSIESLFRKADSFGEQEARDLHKILLNCKRPKIIVVKNNKKAVIWKRRFAKNFVIKKSEL